VKAEEKTAKVHASGKKPRVVVLGSGWGAVSVLQGMTEEEAAMYDITVVSMRNHFLYTPLLPTCTMGSVEERSICTPMRRITAGKAEFIEARIDSIDTKDQVVKCSRAGNPSKRSDMNYDRFPEADVEGKLHIDVPYDILIYSVGAEANDFNCPGVKEHAFMFKEVEHARAIRNKISDVFEKASLPSCTEEERAQLLSFVVVGAGPTGVEVAADMADFLDEDVKELYPKLAKYVKVQLISTGGAVLSTYDKDVGEATFEVFEKREGTEILKNLRVKEVTQDVVKCSRKIDGEIVEIPFGCLVWAAGIKENKLSKQLKLSLQEMNVGCSEFEASMQDNVRGVVTDECLMVKGSNGTIFALGDASTMQVSRSTVRAEELFLKYDDDNSGSLDVSELKELFNEMSEEFPQFAEYAKFFDAKAGDSEAPDSMIEAMGGVFKAAKDARESVGNLTAARAGSKTATLGSDAIEKQLSEVDIDGNTVLDLEEFKDLLAAIDKNLRSFPATAQVAAQQGKYLGGLLATGRPAGDLKSYKEAEEEKGVFTYFHKGALAYIGNGEAAFDLPVVGAVTGKIAGLGWKAYETSAQVTWKNRVLVGLDWVRTELFGRDTSRF
jgi:NADH:ubiquinone reductase (non-electrogenic)